MADWPKNSVIHIFKWLVKHKIAGIVLRIYVGRICKNMTGVFGYGKGKEYGIATNSNLKDGMINLKQFEIHLGKFIVP